MRKSRIMGIAANEVIANILNALRMKMDEFATAQNSVPEPWTLTC